MKMNNRYVKFVGKNWNQQLTNAFYGVYGRFLMLKCRARLLASLKFLLFLGFTFIRTITYSENISSNQVTEQKVFTGSLLLIWSIDSTEKENISEYHTFLSLIERYISTRFVLSISPETLQYWSTNSPDLVAKITRLWKDKRIELIFPPWRQLIFPLIYDLDSVVSPDFTVPAGTKNNSDLSIPPGKIKFSYPEDIREQVIRSWTYSTNTFGFVPTGIVPPAGAVSEKVVDLLFQLGIRWIIVPQNILGNIEYLPLVTFSVSPNLRSATDVLPQSKSNELIFYINNSFLAELIETPDTLTAPVDLVNLWTKSVLNLISTYRLPLIVVHISGRKFWQNNGTQAKEISQLLIQEIATLSGINTILPSEFKTDTLFMPVLNRFKPVSWYQHDPQPFSLWYGEGEENAAWKLLADARKLIEQYKNSGQAELKKLESVLDEIYQVEDGDNFLYFGKDYNSLKDTELDRTFRTRLSNIYKTLNLTPPADLAHPLAGKNIFSIVNKTESSKLVPTKIDKTDSGFTFTDAMEDDTGPGEFLYPTSPVQRGMFDLYKFTCTFDTGTIIYTVEFAPQERISGLGIAGVDVYIDMNNRTGAGLIQTLPKRNVYTTGEKAWEYCLHIRNKIAYLFQALPNETWRMINTFPVSLISGRKCSVGIPRTIMRGVPLNWNYIILVVGLNPQSTGYTGEEIIAVKEMPQSDTFGGAVLGKDAPPVIDWIPPPGTDQYDTLGLYKEGKVVQLPALRIQ